MSMIAEEVGCAEQLAKFFPQISAIRIPVRVEPLRVGQSKVRESTVLEYSTGEIAIFVSNLPIEFNDRLRISREGGGESAEASVIALQYHEGRKAVAVRFTDGRRNWVRVQ